MITVPVKGTPALFTDRDGNPIWYYDVGQNYPYTFKLLPTGHVILTLINPTDSILREIDLAGNSSRMDIYALRTQVAERRL